MTSLARRTGSGRLEARDFRSHNETLMSYANCAPSLRNSCSDNSLRREMYPFPDSLLGDGK